MVHGDIISIIKLYLQLIVVVIPISEHFHRYPSQVWKLNKSITTYFGYIFNGLTLPGQVETDTIGKKEWHSYLN